MRWLLTTQYLRNKPVIGVVLFAFIAFLPGLGSVHLFDWDEVNFAEIAREMLVTHNYTQVQVDFEPFYEKPPLFFWLQVLSMKIFGVHALAARLPNALLGVLTLYTLYRMGQSLKNSRLGLLFALMYGSALLPHFYFKTGIIDPLFNYFILLGVYCSTRLLDAYQQKQKNIIWAFLGGVFIGLAVLTKGPVALLLIGLTGVFYWVLGKFKPVCRLLELFVFALTALFIPLLWFGYETYLHGPGFIQAFLTYQIELLTQPVAGHGQPFYYHFIVVLLGCFPTAVLALGSLFKATKQQENSFFLLMKLLFWVVMVVFSLVNTKIVHYSSMAYFPIAFLAADYLDVLYTKHTKANKPSQSINFAFMVFGVIVTGLLVSIPLLGLLKNYWCHWITDPFTQAIIAMDVPWTWLNCLVGVVYGWLLIIAYGFLKKGAVIVFAWLTSFNTMLALSLGTFWIVPKIEAHIQKPVIEFYQQLAGQAVYVTTVGFKSYAPYFYFQQENDGQSQRKNLDWLLAGNIDKPVYLVTKITDQDRLKAYPHIAYIKTAGGFAFYQRAIRQ